MGVPAGVIQKEDHTEFLHLPSAVLALIFLARRVQPLLSLVERKVEFCVLCVCGTRSSMLAGLSCTKGVWYIYDWDTGSTILIW